MVSCRLTRTCGVSSRSGSVTRTTGKIVGTRTAPKTRTPTGPGERAPEVSGPGALSSISSASKRTRGRMTTSGGSDSVKPHASTRKPMPRSVGASAFSEPPTTRRMKMAPPPAARLMWSAPAPAVCRQWRDHRLPVCRCKSHPRSRTPSGVPALPAEAMRLSQGSGGSRPTPTGVPARPAYRRRSTQTWVSVLRTKKRAPAHAGRNGRFASISGRRRVRLAGRQETPRRVLCHQCGR